MGFSECGVIELPDDAAPAPDPCGPCAAAIPAPNETLKIDTATTAASFFICPPNRYFRLDLRDPHGSHASVGHAVPSVASARV